jgi:hypothetical protein
LSILRSQHIDGDIDADMDASAYAVGGAEFGHPHEHDDAQFLCPGQVDAVEDRIEPRHAERIALRHRNEDQKRCDRDQARDQNFL